ncbi:hypothetical protein RP20_CCG000558 [Aedes albopictus]|nr:hypothetical protein RP20_CCG000558 [Aedes albopictus]
MVLSSFKLSFADDLKFFRIIETPNDCTALQEDINSLLMWCNDNGMFVNGQKCKVLSFSRSKNPMHHQYTLEAQPLQRVTSIRDLGVTIDAKLTFNEHVGITTAKAFSVLGFIHRHASDFTDIFALKSLYCSLVRSILEYAAPIWIPYYTTHILSIERVQKKFVRFALRRLPWNDPINLPAYSERCKLIGLEPLSTRRTKLQRLFIFDVIQGTIDCPALLQQISFNVPPRSLRFSSLLSVPYHRSNYGYNNPLDSCIRAFNDVSNVYDFNITKAVFKNRISQVV